MFNAPGHHSGPSRSPGPTEGSVVARLSDLWRHGLEPDLRAFLAEAGQLAP